MLLGKVFFYAVLSFTALLVGVVAALLVLWVMEQVEASREPRGGFRHVSEFAIGAGVGMVLLAILIPNVLATQSFRSSQTNKWLALALVISGFLGLLGYVFREAFLERHESPLARAGTPVSPRPAVVPLPVKREPSPLTAKQPHVCAAKLIEHPVCGLVVTVAVVGTDQSAFAGFRTMVQEEVAQHRPWHVLIDLTEFSGGVDALLISALVSALSAVYTVRGKQGTLTVVATGQTASSLERALPVMKLYDLFGGRVHRDVPSALEHLVGTAGSHP